MAKWICELCGFIYDEEQGLVREGIAPGTRWEDVPTDWLCPDCGVGKSDFKMVALSPASTSQKKTGTRELIIIGSGMAGAGLALELANQSPPYAENITLITEESIGYYSRPLMSHAYSSEENFHRLILYDFEQIEKMGIKVRTSTTVKKIDTDNQIIVIEPLRGNPTDPHSPQQEFHYETLVLAMGSAAFVPPPWLSQQNNFLTLNRYEDLIKIREIRKQGKTHWGIIGGGLIGCEIASDLHLAGDQITLIHGMDRLMERFYSVDKSKKLYDFFTNKGIKVHLDSMVQSIERDDNGIVIHDKNQSYAVDHAIVAVGFRPRIHLAKEAGLQVNQGIVVDAFLRTSEKNIFAIGDGAEINGNLYPFVTPIRSQVKYFSRFLCGQEQSGWQVPEFTAQAKIHGFESGLKAMEKKW